MSVQSTTGFVIDNGTGQAVRLVLQNAIQAVANCSAGQQSNLGTTVPCQLFADTQNGLLKIRDTGGNNSGPLATFHTIGSLNTANLGLLSKTGGTLTGVLGLPVGATSAPSVNFGDSTTGFFRVSSNVIGISIGGTDSFNFKSGGIQLKAAKSIIFSDSNSSHSISLKSPSTVSSNKTYTLPPTSSANQVLTVNGSSEMSFTNSLTSLTSVQTTTLKSNSNNPLEIKNSSNTEVGRFARSFINVNTFQGNSIRRSFNVSSLTDHAEGDYSLNFATSIPTGGSAHVTVSLERFTGNNHTVGYLKNDEGATSSSVRVQICNPNNSGQRLDKHSVNVSVFS